MIGEKAMADKPCKAYFKFSYGGGLSPFFVMLSDLDRLEAAQGAISTGALGFKRRSGGGASQL